MEDNTMLIHSVWKDACLLLQKNKTRHRDSSSQIKEQQQQEDR